MTGSLILHFRFNLVTRTLVPWCPPILFANTRNRIQILNHLWSMTICLLNFLYLIEADTFLLRFEVEICKNKPEKRAISAKRDISCSKVNWKENNYYSNYSFGQGGTIDERHHVIMMLKSCLIRRALKARCLTKIFTIKHKLQAWKKETNGIRSFGHSETLALIVNSRLCGRVVLLWTPWTKPALQVRLAAALDSPWNQLPSLFLCIVFRVRFAYSAMVLFWSRSIKQQHCKLYQTFSSLPWPSLTCPWACWWIRYWFQKLQWIGGKGIIGYQN